jgi:branched-chain amino acid transport system permease protein
MITDHIFLTSINVLLAWSTYIVLMTGGLSFASGAFMAVGCYVAAALTVKYDWPMYPACLVAAVIAAFVGAIVGFPALRVRGIYLILVTLGISISAVVVFENLEFFGGSMGIGGMSGASYMDALIAVVVIGAALFVVSRSPLQRTLDAIREDDRVAESLGINIVFVKVVAFAISAAVAGYAGALYGHYIAYVRPDTFSAEVALFIVLYVVLGGTNNFIGPALGAAIMTLLPEYIAFLKEWRTIVFSAALVLLIMVRPEGLLAFRMITARLMAKPAPQGGTAGDI